MKADVKKAMFALRDDLKRDSLEKTTVVVNRNDLELVVNQLFFGNDEWSNQSAVGYAIAAAESIGMSNKDIKKLTGAMYSEFDKRTLDSAAEIYRKSEY